MSFLEHLEATIDLKNNLLTTGQGDTASLRRLSTAHRAVSLTNFSPSGWNLPVSLRRHPGIDPFVLQEEVPPTFHFAQYAADRVTVWLLHGKDLHYLQTLPGPRDNLVFPSDCQDLQDATSLEPERVTYARLSDGHKMIIRDQWRSPAAHPLAGSWTGAVVFASTSATLADSILLGERCIATEPLSAQTAFPSMAASSSSSPQSGHEGPWAKFARLERGKGGAVDRAVHDAVHDSFGACLTPCTTTTQADPMSSTSSTPASPALQALHGGSPKNSKNKQVSFGSDDGNFCSVSTFS